MEALNVNWVERSEKTLEELKKIKEKKDQDRLDRVRSMRFAFMALGQSLANGIACCDFLHVVLPVSVVCRLRPSRASRESA